LGYKLKVGAHMAELRRTKAGPFTEDNLFTLQDLQDAFYYFKKENNDKFLRKIIQPVENAISHLPKIWVFDTTISSLCHGTDLKIPGISKLNDKIEKNNTVALMTLKDELIALGNAKLSSDEIIKNKQGIAVKTDKVFMNPEIYKVLEN
jgi:H/ACA ribonucleoprotein complex subunit 4